MFNINSRLNQFKEAAEKTQSGEWPPEQFRAFMDEMMPLMQEKGRKVRESLEDWGYTKMAPEECDEGFNGIDMWNDGMAEMYAFLEDGEAQHLHDGLAMCTEGNAKVNKAMLMNRDAYEELEINFQM